VTGPVKSVRPANLHAGSVGVLALAAQGFFWVGGERRDSAVGPVLRAPMYVEYWIPQELRHPWPLVMVHGGELNSDAVAAVLVEWIKIRDLA